MEILRTRKKCNKNVSSNAIVTWVSNCKFINDSVNGSQFFKYLSIVLCAF